MTDFDITASEVADEVAENDVDLFDETDETEETATTTEDNQKETKEDGGIEETNQPAEEVKYTLEHLGEVREVSLEEMKSLAQKGWDYDHVRQGYDQYKEYKEMFNELVAGTDITPQQFVQEYRQGLMEAEIQERTAEIMESELVNESIAERLARAEIENKYANKQRENAMRAENQRLQAEAQQKQQVMADIEMLVNIRPEIAEANFKFPDEVMKMVSSGMPLSSAYLGWVAKQSEVKATQLEQTLKNGQKDVGSMKSEARGEKDPFLKGLLSDW